MTVLPQNLNNVLIERLERGDLATVEHLLGMGFGPFDTLARIDLKNTGNQPFTRTLWSWSTHAKTAAPSVLERWGAALLDTVRATPFAWRDRMNNAWAWDHWDLWSIDNTLSSTADSPLWTIAWREATRAIAVAYGESPDAPSQDPGFWTRNAGQRIVAGLAQQLEQPRTVQQVDVVWSRLMAQGLPPSVWDQRLPLVSSATDRELQRPLAWAAQMGAWGMVERLARTGTNPDAPYTCRNDRPDGPSDEWSVTPLALCLQGLVLNHHIDNHRAVPDFRGRVARAMQALLDAGASLDTPSVIMAWNGTPQDDHGPQRRHHDDERHVLCGCEPWAGSPSVREVLRAWVDHPQARGEPVQGMLDGVPVAQVHAWRNRLDNDELRQSLTAWPVPPSGPTRSRL